MAPYLSPAGEFPAQSNRFGAPVTGVGQFIGAFNVAAPDFEFRIPNASTLPGFDAAKGFEFRAFAGSFQDDGIGEDRQSSLSMSIYQLPLQSRWRLLSFH